MLTLEEANLSNLNLELLSRSTRIFNLDIHHRQPSRLRGLNLEDTLVPFPISVGASILQDIILEPASGLDLKIIP